MYASILFSFSGDLGSKGYGIQDLKGLIQWGGGGLDLEGPLLGLFSWDVGLGLRV